MSSSEYRKRTSIVNARCFPEEVAAIKQKAADSGVSVSEFMRCAALGRKTRSVMDSQVINELRRLGGLQKHLFNQSGGNLSQEYAAVLKALEAAIHRIEG